MYCCYFFGIGKGLALHVNKRNSLHQRILCAKLCWYWPSGSWEEFLIFLYVIYLPLERVLAFHFRKLESPFSKDALCQVDRICHEVVKSFQTFGRRMDNRWSGKLIWAVRLDDLKSLHVIELKTIFSMNVPFYQSLICFTDLILVNKKCKYILFHFFPDFWDSIVMSVV